MSGGVKERPILFSAPMVRALLDGSKTQTRRIIKHNGASGFSVDFQKTQTFQDKLTPRCPHGQPGDRLWVRETWGVVSNTWDGDGNLADWIPDRPATAIHEMRFGQGYYSGHAIYAADGSYEWAGDDDGGGEPRSAWHPSIHMPRAAGRILLEIVSVRVERLNDCSEADARAEGAAGYEEGVDAPPPDDDAVWSYQASYRRLWESINGAGSWSANPWVWVIEFKRVAPAPRETEAA